MAAPAQPRSDSLHIPGNQALEVVLRDVTGRAIETTYGPRVMFRTSKNEILWTKPDEAKQIHALGLRPNEPLRIYKHIRKGEPPYIVFSRAVEDSQPERSGMAISPPAASVGPASTEVDPSRSSQPNSTPVAIPHTTLLSTLAAAYQCAIEALSEAEVYAKRKGIAFRITEEAVHTSANSVFIEISRAKDRELRQKEYSARWGGLS